MYSRDDSVRVVVQGVFPGKHGPPYCVAQADGIDGSVTFSLDPTVWVEQEYPEPGETVLLENLRNKRAGWRAKKGRFWKLSDEQKENRKEHCMKKSLKDDLSGIVKIYGEFTLEQKEVWRQWVDLCERGDENKKLVALLSSDVDHVFKATALMILLTPSSEQKFLPVYWIDRWAVGFTGHWWRVEKGGEVLSLLSPQLIAFGARVLCANIQPLKGSEDRGDKHALNDLNYTLIDFLAKLPVASVEAGQCFRLFSLREIVPPYCDTDFSSGYQPFYNLLADKEVPEVWKVTADADMRERIRAEIAGSAKPRAEWEGALDWYRRTLSQLGDGGRYSVELLADQLSFYLSVSDLRNKSQCHIFPERAYKVLKGKQFRHLRHLLAQYAAYVEPGFLVYDPKSSDMARMVIEEFKAVDTELAALYFKELEKWKAQSVLRVGQEKKEKETAVLRGIEEKAFLGAMR